MENHCVGYPDPSLKLLTYPYASQVTIVSLVPKHTAVGLAAFITAILSWLSSALYSSLVGGIFLLQGYIILLHKQVVSFRIVNRCNVLFEAIA